MNFLGEIIVIFGVFRDFGVFGEIFLVNGRFLRFFFFVFFEKFGIVGSAKFGGLVFLKFGAAGEGVGLGVIGSFLMLGFSKVGGKLDGLLVAQIAFGSNGLSSSRESGISRRGMNGGRLFGVFVFGDGFGF